MAIQVNGTTVIDNSRNLTNIASVDAATVAALNAAGVGGGGADWSVVNTVTDNTERTSYYNSPSYTYTVPSDAVEIFLQWEGTVRAISTPDHMQGISMAVINSSNNTNWYDGLRRNYYRYSYDTTYRYGKVGVPYRLETATYSLDTADYKRTPNFNLQFAGHAYVVSSSSVQEFSTQTIGTSYDSYNDPFAPGQTMKYGWQLGSNTACKNVTFKLLVNRGEPVIVG